MNETRTLQKELKAVSKKYEQRSRQCQKAPPDSARWWRKFAALCIYRSRINVLHKRIVMIENGEAEPYYTFIEARVMHRAGLGVINRNGR